MISESFIDGANVRLLWLDLNSLSFATAIMSLRRFSYVLAGTSGIFLCLYAYRMIVLRRDDQAHGRTPLFIAAAEGQEKRVQRLLGAGAVVDQATNAGGTPLCCTIGWVP